jgi:hypothetical protein
VSHDQSISPSVKPSLDLVDIFIVLLFSASIVIFIFTIGTQFINSPAFQILPAFVTDAYSAIWASLASGGAGVGLVVVKSLLQDRTARPNYFLYVALTSTAFVFAVIAIAMVSQYLNPRPPLYPPTGVTLLDKAGPASFEFSSLPGSQASVRMKGTYQVKDGEVSGHLDEGSVTTTALFQPPFSMTLSRLEMRSCYIHPVYGADQMDVFPPIGKSENTQDINIKLEKDHTYELPKMNFKFKLANDARLNRTWLCAALDNDAGYMPAQ